MNEVELFTSNLWIKIKPAIKLRKKLSALFLDQIANGSLQVAQDVGLLVAEEPLGRAFQGALIGAFELLQCCPLRREDLFGHLVTRFAVAYYVMEGFH